MKLDGYVVTPPSVLSASTTAVCSIRPSPLRSGSGELSGHGGSGSHTTSESSSPVPSTMLFSSDACGSDALCPCSNVCATAAKIRAKSWRTRTTKMAVRWRAITCTSLHTMLAFVLGHILEQRVSRVEMQTPLKPAAALGVGRTRPVKKT